MPGFTARYRAFDRFQQRHRWLGFPLAVRQKYSDDQGGYLAATVTYYGFFSLFPLLLVLDDGARLRPARAQPPRAVDRRLGARPVPGDRQAAPSRTRCTATGSRSGVGIAVALWAGMGVFLAAQNAMNQVWGVPFSRRPGLPPLARQRAPAAARCSAAALLATTLLSGLGTFGASYGLAWKVGLDRALDGAQRRASSGSASACSPPQDVTWRQLRGGAIAAAIGYEVLQALGGYYVGHVVKGRERDLRHLRARDRAAVLDLPGGAHHPARGRGERRRDPAPLAAQPLARGRAAADDRRTSAH